MILIGFYFLVAVSDIDAVRIVSFEDFEMHYMILGGEGSTGQSYAEKTPFNRWQVIGYHNGSLHILGPSKGHGSPVEEIMQSVSVWKSGDDGWEFVRRVLVKSTSFFYAGDRLAFSECGDRKCSIFFDGGRPEAATRIVLPSEHQLGPGRIPFWRTNHNSIVYEDLRKRIVQYSPTSKTVEVLTTGESPKLSPDGNFFALLRDGAVWLFDLITREERRLVRKPFLFRSISSNFFWSRNSTYIYINISSSYDFGEGWSCIQVDSRTLKKKRIWRHRRGCQAEM